nr:unnamed protein product [Digitaria exilis]
MPWTGLRSPSPAPTVAWMGRRPRTARWPRGRLPAARRVVVASAAASDANSSSNSPERDEEREEVARKVKEEKAAASLLMRSQKYAMLKQQLAVAAQFEDYKEAARLRDSLRSFEEEEPGIRVQVRSVYIESRSQPLKGQFFFAYRIRITNNSQRPVQLLRRHWIVTDGNGKTENIWGVGVVGEQPVIFPGTGFEYSSACPLSTPNGRMEGDFEMKHIDKAGSSTFNVAIAPFSLSILGDDNDVLL